MAAVASHFAVGIDLGGQHCCIAVVTEDKGIEVLANDQGKRKFASAIAYYNSELLFGDEAKAKLARDPSSCVQNIKYGIMRSILPFVCTSAIDEVKSVTSAALDQTSFLAMDPVTHYAWVLKRLKSLAARYLSLKESTMMNAVISIPSCLNLEQRKYVIQGATMVGFNVVRLVDDPMAALIAHGHNAWINRHLSSCPSSSGKKERIVITIDCGATGTHYSIGKMDGDVIESMIARSDPDFCGNVVDDLLLNDTVEKIKSLLSTDVIAPKMLERVRMACEKAKRDLSTCARANIEVEGVLSTRSTAASAADDDGSSDFKTTITRDRLDELIASALSRVIPQIVNMLTDSKTSRSEIDDVVLVGGSSRIIRFQTILKTLFGEHKIRRTLNADEAVVNGCAVLAARLSSIPKMNGGLAISNGIDLTAVIDGKSYPVCRRTDTIPRLEMFTVMTSVADQKELMIKFHHHDQIVGQSVVCLTTLTIGTSVVAMLKPARSIITICVAVNVDWGLEVDASMVVDDKRYKLVTSTEVRGMSEDRVARVACELAILAQELARQERRAAEMDESMVTES
jgi:heat shock protein 1/8